ncbi:hypothetical protein ACFYP4_04410 [Streptomyces sp. NPDC005551]|uniref:hypothetical protein n=1 Tax=unclassified Streptomyces TaxID=2593676 RepID=UPI00340B1068
MSGSNPRGTGRWSGALRSPWTVACAVVTVVIGPAAATASALDRANAAPPLHAAPEGHRTGPRTGPPLLPDAR